MQRERELTNPWKMTQLDQPHLKQRNENKKSCREHDTLTVESPIRSGLCSDPINSENMYPIETSDRSSISCGMLANFLAVTEKVMFTRSRSTLNPRYKSSQTIKTIKWNPSCIRDTSTSCLELFQEWSRRIHCYSRVVVTKYFSFGRYEVWFLKSQSL